MRVLVTGVAGFIGSHLAEALVARGDEVVGVDCFTPYYPEAEKRANLQRLLLPEVDFEFVHVDLRSADIATLLSGVDLVFHHAAQPGVRQSWAQGFEAYEENNVKATLRLLEAVRRTGVDRLVYASSSSVYGNSSRYPSQEGDLPAPLSPYGVTKLAAEHLCSLYAANWAMPVVSLRYFTVYGPRQRPDMAIRRILDAARTGTPFKLFGDGSQVRDFTFVSDVVAANLATATSDLAPGTVLNIAAGRPVRMVDLLALAGDVVQQPVVFDRQQAQPGDVARTGGSIERAVELLGWEPQIELRAGLQAQAQWQMGRAAPPGVGSENG